MFILRVLGKIGLLALLGLSVGSAGSYYRCYAYTPADFKVKTTAPYERIVLAVPKPWPKETIQPLVMLFLSQDGRKMTMSQYLGCVWDSAKGYYRCGGECDAGEVMMGKDMSLYFDTDYKLEVDIEVEKYREEERAGMDLSPGTVRAKATPITCPLYVETLFNPLRDGQYNDGPLRNVCYDTKVKTMSGWRYEGCTLRNRSCHSIHKAHFGKYPSQDDAYQAFLRCVDSQPKTGK